MIWITVKETSSLLGLTPRAIQLSIKRGGYVFRQVQGRGRGGNQYEISLESLSPEAQERYHNKGEKTYKPIFHFTGKQREEADRKAWIVTQYWQSRQTMDEFIASYNGQNSDDKINKNQLFRWQKKYKKNKDVADLIDTRGGYNRGGCSIPEEAWEYFYALYMTTQQLSVQRCYEFTKAEYPDIPSISTFERKVRTIPAYPLIEFRQGEKALRDHLPSMRRDKTDIQSNDIWFSDHHLMDTFVLNDKGKAERPWLTVFFDARSNKIISYLLRFASPNATAVKQCLRKGVEVEGIPGELYFDNGPDYRSKYFSKDYPLSLINQLGIKTIYATPYHGQAKSVERFFGTLEDRFGRLFATYAGKDAKNRPEHMRISNEEIAKIALPFQEYLKALDDYMAEYNRTPSRGLDMDKKSPNQVYSENLAVKRELKDPEILGILCGTFEKRIVHENGISILNNTFYSELLIPYFRQEVIVSFQLDNIDKVNIFDTDFKAICVANAKIHTPYRNTTEEEYKKAAKEKKAIRKFNKEYSSKREMDIHQLIAKNQLEEKNFQNSTTAAVVTTVSPAALENTKKLKATERTRGRRIPEEDDMGLLLFGISEREKKEVEEIDKRVQSSTY